MSAEYETDKATGETGGQPAVDPTSDSPGAADDTPAAGVGIETPDMDHPTDRTPDFSDAFNATEPRDDYFVEWQQCCQTIPAEELVWQHMAEPNDDELTFLTKQLSQPGLNIIPDMDYVEMEQMFHWMQRHISVQDNVETWFLNGSVNMDSITATAVVFDALARLEEERSAQHIFDPRLQAESPRVLVILDLQETRMTLEKRQNLEVAARLSELGLTVLVLLGAGQQAIGTNTGVAIWAHDFQNIWWRQFVCRVWAEHQTEPSDAAWTLCMQATEQERDAIASELENPKRLGNLRDLLLKSVEPLDEPDAVEAIRKVLSVFRDQNKDESELRKLLSEVFQTNKKGSGNISRLNLSSPDVAPLEPHATAVFVFWAALQSTELENLRLEYFNYEFNIQLARVAAREEATRDATLQDKSLGKKERKAKAAALHTDALDFSRLDDARKRLQLQELFRQLKIIRRHDRQRGEVIEFRFVNAVDVISDFFRIEAPDYLATQIDTFLADWETLFEAQEHVNRVARVLALRRFQQKGSLSESLIRTQIADEVTSAFVTSLSRVKLRSSRVRMASKFADFIVYWFDTWVASHEKAGDDAPNAVRDLLSDIFVRLMQYGSDVVVDRDLVFARILDRVTGARENIIELEKFVRTVGNSASASLQYVVLSFFDQLGSLYDETRMADQDVLPQANSRSSSRWRRASRLQYQLFTVAGQELDRIRSDESSSYYSRFLAAIAVRVISNCLARANELDYRVTQTPNLSSDRMLSQIFDDPKGIERVVSILFAEPVKTHAHVLYYEIERLGTVEKAAGQINELKQLAVHQSFIGLKIDSEDFGDAADSVAEEKTKIRQAINSQALKIEDIKLLLENEAIISLAGNSFRLCLELHGLLTCSDRREQLDRFMVAFHAAVDEREDRTLFFAAKDQHRAYLLSLCECVHQARMNGNLEQKEARFALDALMKRVDANKVLSLR